ncbi:hypothetical protein DID88_001062 [Monilinia fructigena]|uniref:Uncharacterized protein n=1 Tax=Monilinia fructigena TaxID=38457 RepID=A0A395IZT5_9HELO|nr:hypothetical protein DID88_001062 [Monilinia fructigena]
MIIFAKNRKALLSDLSALVKTAKHLQEFGISPDGFGAENVNDVIDEMILKAFKIVVRATVAEESNVPPTPPADSTSFSGTPHTDPACDTASHRSSIRSSASGPSSSLRPGTQNKTTVLQTAIDCARSCNVASIIHFFNTGQKGFRISPCFTYSTRTSETISKFGFRRLTSSHDTLLSYLGSFIGRLHLQSQSAQDLLATVRQSVTAGQGLLIVVEAVCAHDSQSAELLDNARNVLYDKINKLALAARDIISISGIDEEDVDVSRLRENWVAKTKFVIERIGDFEFEQGEGLGIDVSSMSVVPEQAKTTQDHEDVDDVPGQLSSRPPPPPLIIPNVYEKPLPDVPTSSSPATETNRMSNRLSNNSVLPPLPQMDNPLINQEDYSPSDRASTSDGEFQSFRSGSYRQFLVQTSTSTRATTPDITSHKPRNQPSLSSITMSETQSTFADDPDDLESRMLEKTFAHELLHNKEGQITGGSLFSIGRTPYHARFNPRFDPWWIVLNTWARAHTLQDRLGLRVYNVFKGWLESHWRNTTDYDALFIIESFANDKLKAALPAAGKRLYELAQKVSSTEGPLVPRLVSSIGKTSTSFGQYVPSDVPVPSVVINKSQVAILKNWKMGGVEQSDYHRVRPN